MGQRPKRLKRRKLLITSKDYFFSFWVRKPFSAVLEILAGVDIIEVLKGSRTGVQENIQVWEILLLHESGHRKSRVVIVSSSKYFITSIIMKEQVLGNKLEERTPSGALMCKLQEASW